MNPSACARCGGLYVDRGFTSLYGGTLCRCVTPLRTNAAEFKMTTAGEENVTTDPAVDVAVGPAGDVPVAWVLKCGPFAQCYYGAAKPNMAGYHPDWTAEPLYTRPSPPPVVSTPDAEVEPQEYADSVEESLTIALMVKEGWHGSDFRKRIARCLETNVSLLRRLRGERSGR